MLKGCDFVIISVPLTQETQNMIGEEELAVLKSSAYVIDISRGGVLDHSALIEVLKENRIAGAALDVFPEEPLSEDSELWEMNNVIITPHISANTAYYDDRAVELFAENLQRYVNGDPLLNKIKIEEGY